MKKILILGAGVYQVPLIKKAREMNLYTIVASIPGNYPGFDLADKVYYTDTTDVEKLLEISRSENIDGIVTTGTDVAVEAVGRINDALELRGCSYEAARRACNKYIMKDAFMSHNVPTAVYHIAAISASLDNVEDICTSIGYPVIFKALDSSGSRGITVVKSRDDITRAIEAVRNVTRLSEYIIEKYLVGEEFGAQAFIQDGRIEFVLPHGDYVFQGDTGVPIGHYAPLSHIDNDDVMKATEAAIKALEIDNCAVNMDFILADGKIYVLELGARCGATQLAELVSIYYGFNYYEKILDVAVGVKTIFDTGLAKTPNASHLLLSDTTGVITDIKNNASSIEGVDEIQFDYKIGDRVRKFHVGPDRIGHVITHGATLKDAEDTLDRAMKSIDISVREET